MSRVKTAEGKRVLLAVKVSEGTAGAIDSARGDLRRGQWLEKLIAAALEKERISTAPPDRLPPVIPAVRTDRRPRGKAPAAKARTPRKPPAHPVGASIFQEPGAEPVVADAPPAPAATRKKCPHPGYRQIGGFCRECDHLIEPGGYWREP